MNFGVLQAGLEEQLPAAGGTSLAERQDAVHQALAVVRAHGLEPVLILDDTDKWIRLGGEPDEAVETFFNGPVRWLVDLSAGLIVHVHNRYLDLLGPSSDWFDERVAPPALDSDQLRQVVLGRIEAWNQEFRSSSNPRRCPCCWTPSLPRVSQSALVCGLPATP